MTIKPTITAVYSFENGIIHRDTFNMPEVTKVIDFGGCAKIECIDSDEILNRLKKLRGKDIKIIKFIQKGVNIDSFGSSKTRECNSISSTTK